MKHAILVTGGAGFIGSHFVEHCAKQAMKVVVVDKLTYAGSVKNISHLPPDAYRLVVGDIADGRLVGELLAEHEITMVVNFAAESHVDNSIAAPHDFIHTNIVGTYQLLEACRHYWVHLPNDAQARFRYLQISTDEVYGSLGETGAFSEQSCYQPNSPYSASKAAADHLVRAWFHSYGLPVITSHCTNNYGPRQYSEKLIPHMITCALAGQKLPVYGDGLNRRDWIHVQDHVRGVMLALMHGTIGETYGFGGNAEVSNIELVQKLCQLLDKQRPRADGISYLQQIALVADRPGHDRRYAIDDSKAQSELGFTRNYHFETGLEHTVAWYIEKGRMA